MYTIISVKMKGFISDLIKKLGKIESISVMYVFNILNRRVVTIERSFFSLLLKIVRFGLNTCESKRKLNRSAKLTRSLNLSMNKKPIK